MNLRADSTLPLQCSEQNGQGRIGEQNLESRVKHIWAEELGHVLVIGDNNIKNDTVSPAVASRRVLCF